MLGTIAQFSFRLLWCTFHSQEKYNILICLQWQVSQSLQSNIHFDRYLFVLICVRAHLDNFYTQRWADGRINITRPRWRVAYISLLSAHVFVKLNLSQKQWTTGVCHSYVNVSWNLLGSNVNFFSIIKLKRHYDALCLLSLNLAKWVLVDARLVPNGMTPVCLLQTPCLCQFSAVITKVQILKCFSLTAAFPYSVQ